MENRSKFYGLGRNGKPIKESKIKLWSNDNLQERLKHINGALHAYQSGCLNEDDLKFVIKNAFVSKIYISEKAKGILDSRKPHGNLSWLYDKLINDKVLKICNAANTPFNPYFDICKIAERTPGIIIEHVVPGDEYMDGVKLMKSISNPDFIDIFNAVSICLITKEEDDMLNGMKLKSDMPKDSNNNKIDYKCFPFARYDTVLGAGIKLHGWEIHNGILLKK